MTSNYDSIAKEYKESKELPMRLHIEAYTYFNMLGNLAEKSILDLACGEGFYTRKFKDQGAAKVVGVDISQKMIELAREEETRKFQNIEYILGDVLELGEIGSFDLVVASYLLNYARSSEELLKMCKSIFANLKPGGRFVTINSNPSQAPVSYLKTEKYGFIKSIDSPLIEGTPIKYTFINNHKFTFDNYYLSIPTHEWAFQSVGFKEVRWQLPIVSPDGIKEFGQEFWQDFLDSVPIIGIECFK
ncbi:class I SAM-dependent methyltransferase [Dolichospermum sp. UHCC 0684]|jgi:ubiquinone/menaquinone biosynthesis C-methylase UbiE|uniref:class I SAM-dependent methyltransferase n=1 Tax=unclassified Dolichospermum TaxID=2622029 RepID=UPI001445CF05|nr:MULTISPECIES: class I SAM-dependent methyltransferase [unclassified Dolichospermum]MEA5532214.1 class I SAM-dependent methyltransferase [Dolichospermum sp. UHCC 0684]MTJ18122.1 class I SAM-dependent methyltransferase [Dolichospermum sp. UHCC 0299]MTJ20646.1 class I SAM-dependent methyltransferase [Dolichospermum sp. UHCC 0352]MTJ35796.1 class I SAM-dependent methyltransferase [Dolichospermum sp. UHCC 0260]MTJ41151.1 class I SAM-dependent methyltransferase [Dolichospermum sp. UHCC 0406]